MIDWLKRNWVKALVVLISLSVLSFIIYKYWFVPYRTQVTARENLKKGFIIVKSFNCPNDHPIKANLRSMIYHAPYSTYYNKTNAANGYCFDNTDHAKQQGFRKPYN